MLTGCWKCSLMSKKQIEWVLHFKISSNTNRKGIISLKSIITRNESLIYEFIPEMKQQSMISKHSAFPVQKIFKTQPSAYKTMATVFWVSKGLLLCDFLELRTTINNDRYFKIIQQLHTARRRKRSVWLRERVKLSLYGTRYYISNQIKL